MFLGGLEDALRLGDPLRYFSRKKRIKEKKKALCNRTIKRSNRCFASLNLQQKMYPRSFYITADLFKIKLQYRLSESFVVSFQALYLVSAWLQRLVVCMPGNVVEHLSCSTNLLHYLLEVLVSCPDVGSDLEAGTVVRKWNPWSLSHSEGRYNRTSYRTGRNMRRITKQVCSEYHVEIRCGGCSLWKHWKDALNRINGSVKLSAHGAKCLRLG